jgi:hypothetical protein
VSVVITTTIRCDAPGCNAHFSLERGGLLIRCIAENKDGWRCEDKGGRDFCAEHRSFADPTRIEQPAPQAIGDA